MSGAAYTPWAVDDLGEPDYLDGIKAQFVVYGGNERRIPIAYAFDAASADLIAAAPNLLEALMDFDNWLTSFDPENQADRFAGRKVTIAARAAIAKATGAA